MVPATKSGRGISQSGSSRRGAELTGSSGDGDINHQNDFPLARPLSRRERFGKVASLTWSRGSHDVSEDGPTSARSVLDANFQNDILLGLNRRHPEKSSALLKGRRKGTMNLASEGSPLPRKAEDIRRRQEHVDGRLVQMPVLFSRTAIGDTGLTGIPLVREAFLSELRDLYTILSSVDARKYDVCSSDIRAMFEWFAMFENFLRLYLTVSETTIYQAAEIDAWENIEGMLSKECRMREKKRIIELCDKVEAMKRVLISEGDRGEQKSVEKLREQVDKFTVRLLRFLDEEVVQLPNELNGPRFSRKEAEGFFRAMVNEIRNSEQGKDMVVVLAKGLGTGSSGMGSWLKDVCETGNKFAVQRWMRQFVERHSNYVRLFEKAESEYRWFYKDLSNNVNEEIEEIREEFERTIRSVASSAGVSRDQ